MNLKEALEHPLWKSHKIGDTYKMDGDGQWKITYYPIFECGKTGKVYEEPRALIERPAIFNEVKGTDFREVPLRYLERSCEKPDIRSLGTITTIGELKALIAQYPDNTPFEFRNQPAQQLYELKYQDNVYVFFQPKTDDTEGELCDGLCRVEATVNAKKECVRCGVIHER